VAKGSQASQLGEPMKIGWRFLSCRLKRIQQPYFPGIALLPHTVLWAYDNDITTSGNSCYMTWSYLWWDIGQT